MYLVRRIVVGVEMPHAHPWDAANLEAPTKAAVDQAFQLAQSSRIPLTLVSVLPEPKSGWFESAEHAESNNRAAIAEAGSVLQTLADQFLEDTTPGSAATVDYVVRNGRPWHELLRVSRNEPDVLILCGTRNSGALSRALFGSTGLKLLRNAAGPVWLAHPQQNEDQITNILATTDLSEVGQDVLLTGVAVAKQIPSRLSVLHVCEDMADRYVRRTGLSDEQISDYMQKSRLQAEHGVHSQLAATDYRTLEHGVQVHVATGPADASILNAIADLRINLLIIATQARGGMTGVLLGNTAERLLSEVPCSIIVIKPEGFVSPITF